MFLSSYFKVGKGNKFGLNGRKPRLATIAVLSIKALERQYIAVNFYAQHKKAHAFKA